MNEPKTQTPKDSNVVTNKDVPLRLVIRHALMFVFSDIFTNFVREFEEEIRRHKIQLKHDLKFHFNNYLSSIAKARYEASRFLDKMVIPSNLAVVDDIFKDSDSLALLFKTILDRIVAEEEDDAVIRRIFADVSTRYKSSKLFSELEHKKDIAKAQKLGLICDHFMKCEIPQTDSKDDNGYSYCQYYCKGMWKNCKRRNCYITGTDASGMFPDTYLTPLC